MNTTRKFAVPAVLVAALFGTVLWLVLGKNDPPDAFDHGPVNQTGWEWSDYRSAVLPHSEADGPYETDEGLAHGFSHSRAGALLAATHISARIRPQVGPSIYEPTITDQTTGPGRDTLLGAVRDQYGQTGEEPLDRSASLVGYRFLVSSPQQATLELLISPEGETTRYSAKLDLQWDGSDWKLVVPDGGGWLPQLPDALTQEDFELFTGGSA
ncbi:hypothetical protein [Actinocorallia populi]|uniref:hypothetical protein n=1 Tax=Actinocorallia populi TaxID=2079200 RepID=UPI000D089D64|nr:hypothetical protein [Actinocorallia populi]